MKKLFLLLLLFCFVPDIFCQINIEYFPQEQIVIRGCENSEVKAACFYEYLEKKVSKFILENEKELKRFKLDTLELGGNLVFDLKNKIDKNQSGFSIRIKNIDENLDKKFNSLLNDLPILKIINRKPNSITSIHMLSFNYMTDRAEEKLELKHIPLNTPYSGGIIQEVPRFPGCENLNESEARICFQQKIQEHIRKNFRYPKKAQKNGISGTVNIMFIMEKNGRVIDIRTKGPHQSLEEEAERIIKLLPNVIPGKQNGEPVRVPFSMPINFRLQ